MKLLFIQGGSRLKQSKEGNLYIDGNFSTEVWNRYLPLCDELIIVLRKENAVYEDEYAQKKFNKMPVASNIRIIGVTDIYQPLTNYLNPIIHYNIRKKIYDEIKQVDKVIIRSSSFYSGIAYNACLKYNKSYMFECTGFALESFKYHSLLGKIMAPYFENLCKRIARDAYGVIYVTDKALQQRYPCLSGRMLGCSDVALKELNPEILADRLLKIKACKRPLILGTAAFLDVNWKGQYLVIKAIAALKEKGNSDYIYELIGLGTGKELQALAENLGVSNQIRILGAKKHDDVFKWLDTIDIYVQPSFQEGLCRAIVEAMSCACPIICSNAGGNFELIPQKYIFPCGDYLKLSEILEYCQQDMLQMAKDNFSKSSYFNREKLDKKRLDFLSNFCKNN